MGIGKKLTTLLDSSELNVNELANRINVSPQTIYSMIKRDNKKADIEVLLRISKVFNVTPEYFISDSDNSTDSNNKEYSSDSEQSLLQKYHQLNQEGQEKVLEYTQLLIKSGQYIKSRKSAMVD